jgi:serpin B
MKPILYRVMLIVVLLSLAGCSALPAASPPTERTVPVQPAENTPVPPPVQGQVSDIARSDKPRAVPPASAQDDAENLARSNSDFAFELYRVLLNNDENLFFSPYSISMAMAMSYAGARGETESQMARVLHFALPQDNLHRAWNALDGQVAAAQEEAGEDEEPLTLNIANSLWGQQGFTFSPEYLDTLAENYGAEMRLLDFETNPESARQEINGWVEDETMEKIKDLIPQGAIDEMTRMVIANAIYFKAAWLYNFEKGATFDETFHLLDGSEVQVPTMHQAKMLNYASGSGWRAVELPYEGDRASMLVIVPDDLEEYEQNFSGEQLAEIVKSMQPEQLELSLPKFSYDSSFSLVDALSVLGMPAAFDPDAADFSGITGQRDLFISDVLHKAFVDVNEDGTEAAAATGLIMSVTSAMADPVRMAVDRPFLFVILDKDSGALLFVGRVLDPRL